MKISFCRTPVSPNSEGKLSRWSGIQQAFALAALLFDGHGEGAKIVGNLRIFRRQRIDVADFDVSWLYAGPFGARAEEPAVMSDHTGQCGTYCRESGAAAIARRAGRAQPQRAQSCHQRAALALRVDHQDNNDRAGRCGYDAAERVRPALP